MSIDTVFDRYKLEKHEADSRTRVSISGRYGSCVSMYTPDELDTRALEYARELAALNSKQKLHVADLGSSPFCPQSIRFADCGLHVDAFDLEPPHPELAKIKAELSGDINYIQENINDVTSEQMHQYSMVYTNRCLFFLPFAEAKAVLSKFLDNSVQGARFFISLMDMNGPIAKNFTDREKPLAERFSVVKNDYATKVECNMPVCFYYPDEVQTELLRDLPVHVLELIQTSPRSIKVVFEKK